MRHDWEGRYPQDRACAHDELVNSGIADNRHDVTDHLAAAKVHATLALAAAVLEVASAIRAAGRPMGGRS